MINEINKTWITIIIGFPCLHYTSQIILAKVHMLQILIT